MKLNHPTAILDNKTIALPTSKSINNRLLVMQQLCEQEILIHNTSNSDDTQILTGVMQNLAAEEFNIKNAGTCMRFLTAFLSTQPGTRVLTGSSRMQERPIKILVEALRSLGAKIDYLKNEGYPPLKIQGGSVQGGKVAIAGDVSSQYISALLMIAPALPQGLDLEITGEVLSIPYINMTLSLLKYFGIQYTQEESRIQIQPQAYQPKSISVEPDWSGASYMYALVAGAQKASLRLPNFADQSLQGDAVTRSIYARLGVQTIPYEGGIQLEKQDFTKPNLFEYDFSECPDIAQTVVCSLCQLEVPFKAWGLKTLRIKETDRIHALQTELAKLGYAIEVDENDAMLWNGTKTIAQTDSVRINTYDDHRMAMAFAPLAFKHSIEIDDPNVVQKSYPDFWRDLEILGFKLERRG